MCIRNCPEGENLVTRVRAGGKDSQVLKGSLVAAHTFI